MILRPRFCCLLGLGLLASLPARALFNLNQGKDVVYLSGTYTIGYDSNVFTRAASAASMTQSASLAMDYARQAGLIAVTANVSGTWGQFEGVRGQDYVDPSIAISLRKRQGRTTGVLSLAARRQSQPDPDVGQRTESWSYTGGVDLRYPINDRYFLTNSFQSASRRYSGASVFTNLITHRDAIAVNYAYTSKLDLNAGYSITYSDTSHDTTAVDQAITVGATGSILPKLTGTVRVGLQRRSSDARSIGGESHSSFTSGTTLKWLYSRRLSVNFDLNDDYTISATDISVNRTTAGLHAAFAISSKYAASAGFSYTLSDFLGKAGDGRQDEILQFDASLGVAITTRLRTSLAYDYSLNSSTLSAADYERHNLSLSLIASY